MCVETIDTYHCNLLSHLEDTHQLDAWRSTCVKMAPSWPSMKSRQGRPDIFTGPDGSFEVFAWYCWIYGVPCDAISTWLAEPIDSLFRPGSVICSVSDPEHADVLPVWHALGEASLDFCEEYVE